MRCRLVFNGAKSVNGSLTAGRLFCAVAMVFFGAHIFLFVSSMNGPLTSLFVAVAMGGLSFALAEAYGRGLERSGEVIL